MAPKKETSRKENAAVALSIDDPINTDDWKCVVVMAVEKRSSDNFVLKEFMEEASNGRRRQIKLINFEQFVLKILYDFANGELAFKYMFLLQFSMIFQEAAECIKSKSEIPVHLLVKVVKALLFLYREESIEKLKKKIFNPQDPVKAMAERPAHAGDSSLKRAKSNGIRKEQSVVKGKKATTGQHGTLKIRPPSATKEDTKLLKRGEGVKEAHCIDDSPWNGYFNLYVLLTGFFHPNFPVELIKAQVPLHGILCVDASSSLTPRVSSPSASSSSSSSSPSPGLDGFQDQNPQVNAFAIKKFWDEFLKVLWNPQMTVHFKEVIFQVYRPPKLLCSKNDLRHFVYKEISYLMYDISDYKRQHIQYLEHMKVWNVEESIGSVGTERKGREKYLIEMVELPVECQTIPVIILFILNAICERDSTDLPGRKTPSFNSIDSSLSGPTPSDSIISESILPKRGSSPATPSWTRILTHIETINAWNVFSGIQQLDAKYNLNEASYLFGSLNEIFPEKRSNTCCSPAKNSNLLENLEEALNSENEVFHSFWKQYKKRCRSERTFSVTVDYCLYAFLISKIECSHQLDTGVRLKPPGADTKWIFSADNSLFEATKMENLEKRKWDRTATSCSNGWSAPRNLKTGNRNFFGPREYKLISPGNCRASSAPEFHVVPRLLNDVSFISDLVISGEVVDNIEWDVFEDMSASVSDKFRFQINGFFFVEELNKAKLQQKERQFREEYNCIDHAYSVLTDSIFFVLHNRKDQSNTHREAFNEKLKTKVGLRDFFDYVLEDESEWFKTQREVRRDELCRLPDLSFHSSSFDDCVESDFWMENSLKYQFENKDSKASKETKDRANKAVGTRETAELKNGALTENSNQFSDDETVTESHDFEGYNVEEAAVQFSGVKTVYYAEDSTMTVELVERLYGNQLLGVHIRQGGHTLHLHSFVCPAPHLPKPHCFHITYENGIIVAFAERVAEESEKEDGQIREMAEEYSIVSKSERLSSVTCAREASSTEEIFDLNEEPESTYELKLSLPNGLMVEVLPKVVKPSYIKQHFLGRSCSRSKTVTEERFRLFLPNGDLVRISSEGAFEILKANTSVVSGSLIDLVKESASGTSDEQRRNAPGGRHPSKYEETSSSGSHRIIDEGKVVRSERIWRFQKTDLETNEMYFRRGDGTSYVIKGDGTLCVEFKDGTKISSSPFVNEETRLSENYTETATSTRTSSNSAEDTFSDAEIESEFLFVHEEVTVEHPEYATVIYNSLSQQWKILLPFGSEIIVEKHGHYFVRIDAQTELKVEKEMITMNRFSKRHELQCEVTADLSVYRKMNARGIYCKMKGSKGEIHVVEPNSNNYTVTDGEDERAGKSCEALGAKTAAAHETSDASDAPLMDDGIRSSTKSESERGSSKSKDVDDGVKRERQSESKLNENILSTDKKYFIVRKDMTGLEVLHEEVAKTILTDVDEGSVVYVQPLPGGRNLRCFVLISPNQRESGKEWAVSSVVPPAKLSPVGTKKETSSTYGIPPSWMHPLPKRKKKIKIPENLTCRVFVETVRTDFVPECGRLDYRYCDLEDSSTDDATSIGESGLEKVHHFLKRISEEDQTLLRRMYIMAVKKILARKKNANAAHNQQLANYLSMSKHYLELQEYHAHSIRYRFIPNYFHHPVGTSWLLLNKWVSDLKFATTEPQRNATISVLSSPTFKSESTFSYQELEYDLPSSRTKSYSDLSRKTNISSASAPPILERGEHRTRKNQSTRTVSSAPIYVFKEQSRPDDDFQVPHKETCTLEYDECDRLRIPRKPKISKSPICATIEDLTSLGLI